MTLADIEALAARLGEAVRVIREAQALLGASVAPGAPVPAVAQAPARPVAAQLVSPEQQAELDAWRRSPARAKLLEQFKEPAPVVEP
jgi:hypothetical protein